MKTPTTKKINRGVALTSWYRLADWLGRYSSRCWLRLIDHGWEEHTSAAINIKRHIKTQWGRTDWATGTKEMPSKGYRPPWVTERRIGHGNHRPLRDYFVLGVQLACLFFFYWLRYSNGPHESVISFGPHTRKWRRQTKADACCCCAPAACVWNFSTTCYFTQASCDQVRASSQSFHKPVFALKKKQLYLPSRLVTKKPWVVRSTLVVASNCGSCNDIIQQQTSQTTSYCRNDNDLALLQLVDGPRW